MAKRSEIKKYISVRGLTVTAILAALASVLQMLNFPVPLMPGFIKLDFSELPALLAAFALGPISGVTVCFIKNLVDLIFSGLGETLGIGPLSNFILGASFVFTAGIIYRFHRTRKGAIAAALIGAVVMAAVSLPSNLWLVYPIYEVAFFSEEQIISAYNAILEPLTSKQLTSLWQCLLIFNVPFTFVKALISVIITTLIYKPLSPLLKGVKSSR
ncbi:MAG: ECF transporter S component [Ruminococcus sp.]|jgi:riboflavin transporter FmnP|nr:ECF transporter S component [Ruminococcus sp.]